MLIVQIIMVIDPDCMFVNRMDIVVDEGTPIAQVFACPRLCLVLAYIILGAL